MVNSILLIWGLIPMAVGIGFIFRPRLMTRLERNYARRAKELQRRFFKAHRATGLFFVLLSVVMLLSWFYPVWIFNCFLLARIVAGFLFPSYFEPAETATVVTTYWI